MKNEREEEAAQKVGMLLHRAIEQRANYHAGIAGLDEEKTESLKRIVSGIIETMQVSVVLNAMTHDLPVQSVFVTLIEAMAQWNNSIDSMAKKPSPINN